MHLSTARAAQRLAGEVDVDAPRDGEGHDQRRAHEEVRLDALVDSRLEIAVSREDAGGDDVALRDRFFEIAIEGTGISDASGAAESHQVEAQPVEVRLQPGLLQVLADDAGARSERGLHPGLDAETLLHRLLRQESRGQHHRGVRGVGAGGDRGDHHVAVRQIDRRAPGGARFASDPIGRRPVVHHLGLGERAGVLRVAVRHGVRRLLATAGPRLASAAYADLHAPRHIRFLLRVAVGPGEQREELRFQLAKRNPVLRALGTGDGRFHRAEIQVEDGGVVALPLSRHPEQPLGLEVALHSLHLVFASAGRAQVEAGLLVDGEVPDRRSVLGRHVRQRRTVRHREASGAFAVELDEFADHPGLAQELGDP